MGLSIPGYGIHGTNEPYGVGRRVSHGCIRLYPKDIKKLFFRVPNGTRVRIIYQPIKVGRSGTKLYVEVHRDFMHRFHDPLDEILRQEKLLHWNRKIDWSELSRAIEEQRGVPVVIASR
jgi:L,D-transpeptidase ErfK/SrfK